MNIGQGARAAMALKGVSADQVAQKIGISRQAVNYRLKQSDWKYKDIEKMAEIVGMSADDILDFAKKA